MSELTKRKPDDSADSEGPSKRPRWSEEPTGKCHLLELSDDILLLILRYLTSTSDLLNLCETCHRLSGVGHDVTLWIRVDTRTDKEPMSLRQLRQLLPRLHRRTKFIALKGFLGKGRGHKDLKDSLSPSFLKALGDQCPGLKELILHECYINAASIKIDMFPESIKILRFHRCEVVNISDRESYFKYLSGRMPDLRVLDLTGCGWMNSHSLMSVCKCENLEELILKGCFRIGECFAYTALATRFGFKRLKSADLRDTNIGNTEVPCFGRLSQITKLYMGKSSAEHVTPRAAESEGDGMITDRGIQSLHKVSGDPHVSKITHLSLTHTKVTDASLPKLAKSLPLTWLDLTGTEVTNDAVVEVRRIRPGCLVVRDEL